MKDWIIHGQLETMSFYGEKNCPSNFVTCSFSIILSYLAHRTQALVCHLFFYFLWRHEVPIIAKCLIIRWIIWRLKMLSVLWHTLVINTNRKTSTTSYFNTGWILKNLVKYYKSSHRILRYLPLNSEITPAQKRKEKKMSRTWSKRFKRFMCNR